VQTIFDLPGGAGLRLTTMRYYTPSGRTIQAEGIRPDVLIVPAKPIAATDLVRERDLDGHLAGEQGAAAVPGQIVMKEPERAPGAVDTEPGRDVPADPSRGSDYTLSVSYSLLLKNLAAKP
jgi:carboxyl-terminal processing protease